MKFYVVYQLKGNFSSDDIWFELPDQRIDRTITVQPRHQGPQYQTAQWRWTEHNIAAVKGEIAAARHAKSSEVVLHQVRQIV